MDKQCIYCKQIKPGEAFNRDASKACGLRSYCRDCQRERDKARFQTVSGKRQSLERGRKYRENHRELVRDRAREYSAQPEVIARNAATRDPFKFRARRILRKAVRSGRIVRPNSCQECGWIGRPHAHHEDYNKPLEVLWLCGICHGKRHRKHP